MFLVPVVLLIALGVFWALTRPLELHEHRRLRISASMVLVFILALSLQAGLGIHLFFNVFLFVFLCFLWAPVLAFHLSNGLCQMLFSGGSQVASGGFRPDYREARSKIEDNQFDEAIKLTQAELEKDPSNYEGRVLLASLFHERKMPVEALIHLEAILNNPEATSEQRRNAQAGKNQCLALQKPPEE
jgi:hypothetical protein